MMNENHKLHIDHEEHQAEQHGHFTPEEHAARAEEADSPSGYATRSSARLSRKRDSDHPPEEPVQLGRTRLPSFSGEGSNHKFNDSPSQLCLCQPDPKVPRPRNGEFECFRYVCIP